MRLMAYTPCFRREAGSAGRDTRGMLRAHEFDKVEILAYATPEQAPGAARRAGRPGRGARSPRSACRTASSRSAPATSARATTAASTSRSTRRACDQWLEVVVGQLVQRLPGPPGQHPLPPRRRRQPRRAREIVHTLNGSALAVPRVWAAIVENYRQPDGSVAIPEVLRPYMRGATAIEPRDALDGDRREPSTGGAVRDRRARRRRRRRRPDRAVAALVRRRRRGRRRRAERDDASPRSTPTATPTPAIVLVRGVDERGFVFYTNYDSAKSRQLDAPPARRRRVRAGSTCTARCGCAARSSAVDDAESDAYFASRPARQPDRRVGVAAERACSPTGPSSTRSVADDRGALRRRRRARARRTGAAGGCVPDDDRVLAGPPQPPPRPLRYRRDGDGWEIVRLAP